jgi:hypothetical protein
MVSKYAEAASASSATTSTASVTDAGQPRDASGSQTSIALTPREEFVIDCLRNARYHEDRERFFARIHRTAFVTVASGTATFAWLKAARHILPVS